MSLPRVQQLPVGMCFTYIEYVYFCIETWSNQKMGMCVHMKVAALSASHVCDECLYARVCIRMCHRNPKPLTNHTVDGGRALTSKHASSVT